MDCTVRKCLPHPARGLADGIVAGPILHQKFRGKGVSPGNSDAIHLLYLRKVKNDPLRMERITFSGETLSEVWIALPIRAEIAICQPRKPSVSGAIVAGDATMRKIVPIGVPYRLGRFR